MKELLCGRNSVIDAINSDMPINVIYTSRNDLSEITSGRKVKVVKVDKNKLDKMTNENHQGYIAELPEFNYYSLEQITNDDPDFVLVLDHIQDPRNLGAILRSANAFGVKHIILPKDRAAKVTPSALKTASGGYVGLKIIRVPSLMDAITKLKKQNFWVYASSLKDAKPMKEVPINPKAVVIVGNEEKGVSHTLLKHSDVRFFIPMLGTVQSLNVSVAAGIILSHLEK